MRFRFLVAAGLLWAACDSGGSAPPPTMGSISFSWTVGGMPAATGCPQDGMVTLQAIAPAGASFMKTTACVAGSLVTQPLAPGLYTFRPTLTSNAGSMTGADVNVTVVGGQVVPAMFDLPTGVAGNIAISWTVNGGQHCPAGGMVTAGLATSSMVVAFQTVACDAYQVTIMNVPAGSYTARVLLDSGGQQAMAEQPNAMAPGTVGPLDIPCGFCP